MSHKLTQDGLFDLCFYLWNSSVDPALKRDCVTSDDNWVIHDDVQMKQDWRETMFDSKVAAAKFLTTVSDLPDYQQLIKLH